MFIGDQLCLANSDVFGQGILKIGQGKVSEKSGNFTFYSLWEPCSCLALIRLTVVLCALHDPYYNLKDIIVAIVI